MPSTADTVQTAESFSRAFRSLLWRVRARRLQLGVEILLGKVDRLVAEGLPLQEAFVIVYRRARAQTVRQLVRARGASRGGMSREAAAGGDNNGNGQKSQRLLDQFLAESPPLVGPDFHCDAGLGGLARLLRAAGYDAAFWPGIDDDLLLEKVLHSSAILLTNDTILMERGVIARGVVPTLLVPITLKKREQFARVRSRLQLPLSAPRCMSCGGRLRKTEKESVRERIPPRTYPWRDDYFVCERCNKLFWRGTHWDRICQCLADSSRDAP
jgi:uncharacterized protein with PIN domain